MSNSAAILRGTGRGSAYFVAGEQPVLRQRRPSTECSNLPARCGALARPATSARPPRWHRRPPQHRPQPGRPTPTPRNSSPRRARRARLRPAPNRPCTRHSTSWAASASATNSPNCAAAPTSSPCMMFAQPRHQRHAHQPYRLSIASARRSILLRPCSSTGAANTCGASRGHCRNANTSVWPSIRSRSRSGSAPNRQNVQADSGAGLLSCIATTTCAHKSSPPPPIPNHIHRPGVSRRSVLADLANLREHNERLRHPNTNSPNDSLKCMANRSCTTSAPPEPTKPPPAPPTAT
jgi:hypothetical protein